jgi:gamma-glutamylcyclotransferase (GGCT)/AIG2-like uncharacterized protein YtfP
MQQPYREVFLAGNVKAVKAELPGSELYFEEWPSLVFVESATTAVQGYLVYFPFEIMERKHAEGDEIENVLEGAYLKSVAEVRCGDEMVRAYVYHRTGILKRHLAVLLPHHDWIVDQQLIA